MRAYLNGIHLLNASELVSRAAKAHSEGMVDDETRLSIAAHLLAAIDVEGAINEIGQANLSKWAWEHIEKIDTPSKWFIISNFYFAEPLDPSKEPLQIIDKLYRTRNKLVHPKELDLGEEIIVRRKDGRVLRNVALNDPVEDDDYILVGYGKLLDQFNAETARVTITKVISALQLLKRRSNYQGFEWLEGDFMEQIKMNLIQ